MSRRRDTGRARGRRRGCCPCTRPARRCRSACTRCRRCRCCRRAWRGSSMCRWTDCRCPRRGTDPEGCRHDIPSRSRRGTTSPARGAAPRDGRRGARRRTIPRLRRTLEVKGRAGRPLLCGLRCGVPSARLPSAAVKPAWGPRGVLVTFLILGGAGAALWVWTRPPRLGPLRATPADRRISVEVGEAVHFSAGAPGAVAFTWSIWGSAVSHLPTWTYVALPEDAGWQQVTLVVRGATGSTLARAWDLGVVPLVPPAVDVSPPPGHVVVPAGTRASFHCGARVAAARPSDHLWFEWTVDGRTMSRHEEPATEAVSEFLLPRHPRAPAASHVAGAVGERLRFATGIASDAPDASYDWSVDGRHVQGGATPTFDYTPETPGTHRVAVALRAQGTAVGADSWQVTARERRPVREEASASTARERAPVTGPGRVASVPTPTVPRIPEATMPRIEQRAATPAEVARAPRPGPG